MSENENCHGHSFLFLCLVALHLNAFEVYLLTNILRKITICSNVVTYVWKHATR